jgi:hypothetical protein
VSNATINKVSAMWPGLAMIIEKVHISCYFESPDTDLPMAENACGIHYADTWSLKRVHWMSQSQSMHCSASDYRCEDTLAHNTGVARVCLHITGIHMSVAPKSKIQWLPATCHYSRWLNLCEVSHGGVEAILILDPVDVKEAYSQFPSGHHRI